jgi:hypothetical protein
MYAVTIFQLRAISNSFVTADVDENADLIKIPSGVNQAIVRTQVLSRSSMAKQGMQIGRCRVAGQGVVKSGQSLVGILFAGRLRFQVWERSGMVTWCGDVVARAA